MLMEINFKLFRKLLRKKKLKSVTIDIDSSVVNVDGHQEGAVKGYNPKKPGNRCYNLQFAFCDEIKAYLTVYVRSGDTYTANGTAEMIKEIVTHLKDEGVEITFRMDSGYFDDAILETIESLGGKYVIKGKRYPTLVEQVTDPSIVFVTSVAGRETTELVTALNTWKEDRRFVVLQVLKDENTENNYLSWKAKHTIISFLSPMIWNCRQKKWLNSMKNVETMRTISRKLNMTWQLDTCCSSHFGLMKRSFS
jgi:hypothetical protein